MKILILKSIPNNLLKQDYNISMNTSFADRFIGHLMDREGVCTACEKECIDCRSKYQLDFSENITAVFNFPATLPAIIDDPEFFLPKAIPYHDVLISIAVNEEILYAFIKKYSVQKGIIVPVEESEWISPYGKKSITELCVQRNIELDFPKPFCSFDPKGGILKYFKDYFKIGKPEINIVLDDNRIKRTNVMCSAPCGATYFTARGLEGHRIEDDLCLIIDKQLSSYPCTASTELDREFQDSIIHQAVKIQRNILRSIDHLLPERAL